MKYMATLNGKQYEVELERLDEYQPIPRGGETAAYAPAPASYTPEPMAAYVPTPMEAYVSAPAAAAAAAATPAAPAPAAPMAAAGSTTIEAPMPGKVLEIKVAAGQAVKYGQVVVTMEAMKMETEIVAPADGTVAQILVKAGDAVETGTAMVTLN